MLLCSGYQILPHHAEEVSRLDLLFPANLQILSFVHVIRLIAVLCKCRYGVFLDVCCPLGLVDVSMELFELRLPTDHWIKINQILIRTSEGADGIAAVLCIPMAADNSSLAASFTLGKWQFIQVAELLHNLTFQPICEAWEKETCRAA